MAAPKFATMPEAVQLLELTGKYRHPERWLIRRLRAREAEIGARILIADRPGRGSSYRVNVAVLKRALPELRDPEEALYLTRVHQKLDALAELVSKVADRFDDLDSNLGALAQAERERARGIRR